MHIHTRIHTHIDTHSSSVDKESPCNVEDLGSIPSLGRSPGEVKGCPLQYSGLQNSMDCMVHGVTKSQTRLSNFHFHQLKGLFIDYFKELTLFKKNSCIILMLFIFFISTIICIIYFASPGFCLFFYLFKQYGQVADFRVLHICLFVCFLVIIYKYNFPTQL